MKYVHMPNFSLLRQFSGYLAIILCFLALPVAAAPSTAELKQKISQSIDSRPSVSGAQVGVYIKVLKTGRVVYNRNGSVPMIPASNLKVVTTAVAIDRLGPEHRFTTSLLGPPAGADGVIEGDLVLRGGGDPTFTPPYHANPNEPLRFFARELRKSGVRRIRGGVVADDSIFDRVFLGKGWYDRYLLDAYAAPCGALSLNGNLVTLSITSQKTVAIPDSPSLNIVHKVKEGGGRNAWVDRKRGSDTIVVEGNLAPGIVLERSLTINDPTAFTGGHFLKVLEAEGVPIDGELKMLPEGTKPSLTGLKTYARFRSPNLEKLMIQTNRRSDNLFAEHLFKATAFHFKGYGSAANGEAAVKDFYRRHRIDSHGLKMVDGSGLSELNRISPRQLVGLLGVMWEHPNGQVFIDTLPAGGEGTLRYRLNDLVVRAKTGTLKNHSGLSGYVVSAYGQTLGFSILVNDVQATWSAVELQDHIVKMLVNWNKPL